MAGPPARRRLSTISMRSDAGFVLVVMRACLRACVSVSLWDLDIIVR